MISAITADYKAADQPDDLGKTPDQSKIIGGERVGISPNRICERLRNCKPNKARREMPAAADIGDGKDPRISLGNAVYRHRIKLGISQEDLADQVGLDRTYVSGIERGIRNPTLLVLLRLVQVLAVPVARLLEYDDGEAEPVGQ